MSYLVLARKWRPQSFSDVVSQKHIIQALQNAVRLGRLPHAILLTGSRGIGKTTIARIVAKTVNCAHLDPDAEFPNPCNECSSCLEITDGRSVDVTEIDGASNRSIDDIRDLRENVQYLPNHSRRKVYIIDEVHMLTREAFNALLKTLEEPPSHVLFLFATTEPHKIPITILSRCQRFDFKRITGTELREYLREISTREGLEVSDTALGMVARSADGGMRDAMSLLDQVIAFGGKTPSDEDVAQAIGAIDRSLLHQIGEALLARDIDACLRCVDHLLAHAYDLRQLTQEIANFLRDLMVVAVCKKPEEVTDLASDELQIFQQLAQGKSPDRIQQMFRILTKAAEEVARANYPRLLLEMTLIQMARVEPVQPFDDVIRQLGALEQRLEQGLPPGSGSSGSSGGSGGSPGTPESSGGSTQRASAPQQGQTTQPQSASPSVPFSQSSAPPSRPRPTPAPIPPQPPAAPQSPMSAGQGGLQQMSSVPTSAPLNVIPTPSFSEPPKTEPPRTNGVAKKASEPVLPKSPSRRSKEKESIIPASLIKIAAQNSAAEESGPDFTFAEEPAPKRDPSEISPEEVEVILAGHSSVHQEGAPVSEEQWTEVVSEYRDQHPFVGESLQFARYAFNADGVVRLVFPSSGVFRYDRLKTEEARQAFESFCEERGVSLRLDATLLEEDELPNTHQYSIWERKLAVHARKMHVMRKEAEEHPVIQNIVAKIPGTEIIKVEPVQLEVLEDIEKE